MSQTIELDAPPGPMRPDGLLQTVLEDISEAIPIRDPVSRTFGHWVFDYSDIEPAVWQAHNAIIKFRIQSLSPYPRGNSLRT